RAPHGASLLLERAPMLTVGRLSYGWYLWHWPALLIGPAALGMPPSLRVKLLLAAAALGVAAVTYRFVENPLRHLRGRPSLGLGIGAALTVLVIAASVTVAVLPHRVTGGREAPDLRIGLSVAADPAGVLRHYLATGGGERLPSNLTPTL